MGVLAGQQRIQQRRSEPAGDEEMVWLVAFVIGWIGEAGVADHQLVQIRGAAAPVADDEDRRVLDFGSGDAAAVERWPPGARCRWSCRWCSRR